MATLRSPGKNKAPFYSEALSPRSAVDGRYGVAVAEIEALFASKFLAARRLPRHECRSR